MSRRRLTYIILSSERSTHTIQNLHNRVSTVGLYSLGGGQSRQTLDMNQSRSLFEIHIRMAITVFEVGHGGAGQIRLESQIR